MNLISRDASAAFKGFLILLIVLAHNELLMTNSAGGQSFALDCFQLFIVHGFFLLPFLYGPKELTGRRALDYLAKLCVPYAWIFGVCLLINAAYTHRVSTPLEYGHAFIFGNGALLKSTIGFNFPWFLPAMFSLLLMKGLYGRGGAWPVALSIVSVAYWVSIVMFGVNRFIVGNYTPLGISQSLYALPIALVSSALCVKIAARANPAAVRWSSALLFALMVTAHYHRNLWPGPVGRLIWFFMPVSSSVLLFSCRDWLARNRLLIVLGVYSLPIYLVHVIVYNGLARGVQRLHAGRHPGWAWGIFLLTVGISLGFSMALKKFRRLHDWIFPSALGRAA